ncbi:MAG: alpha/beta hydrolase [Clostridia bacterium]|nr:alpha/beta hydrolase [Clostridia bacterium]
MPATSAVVTVLWAVFGIAMFYLVFIFAPSLVGLIGMFSRIEEGRTSFDAPVKDYMTKYSGMIEEGRSYLLGLRYEKAAIGSSDGLTLCGFYFDRQAEKTVLLVHGYHATAMVNFAWHAMEFIKRGYNVLMICQRAHCESGGRFCSMGIRESEDAARWTEYLKGRGCRKIAVYGISMGAACVGLASDQFDSGSVKALVMDCGFVSPYSQIKRELRRRHLPAFAMLPVMSVLSKIIFRADIRKKAADSLKKCSIPVCFIHGEADMTVAPGDSGKNYESCASEKQIYMIKDAPHTAGLLGADNETKEKIFGFIESCMQKEK